jgi:hypothetical protein
MSNYSKRRRLSAFHFSFSLSLPTAPRPRPVAAALVPWLEHLTLALVRSSHVDVDAWLFVLVLVALAGAIYRSRDQIAADKRRFEAWVDSWLERIFRGNRRD